MIANFYNYFHFCCITLSILLLNGCASLTGYQDGRSIGEGNGEAMISLNMSQSPSFSKIEDAGIIEDIPRFIFPNIEIAGRYGVSKDLDVTLRMNTNLNVGVGAKYQILGDRHSKYALGTGFELGTFGLISGLWNLQIPLYASIHPTESFAFYISPRFIHQFSTFGGTVGWNYLGGNAGFLFGSKHKFGIDFGYYEVGTSDLTRVGLGSIGIGGKFFIGDDEENSIPNKKTKKRRK